MKLSFKAFREHLDFTGTPQELADVLSSLGFPNDGISAEGAGVRATVLGKILEKNKHPQADRLSLLKVDIGSEVLPVVCGASNMEALDYVALAPVGATIPGKGGAGMTMKEAKIRGETSRGMCCSAEELGLSSDGQDGILVFKESEIPQGAKLGTSIADLFDLEDSILEVDVTPNRGDAMAIRGLAREVAAKLGLRLKTMAAAKWKTPTSLVKPSVESSADTPAFAACLIQNVQWKTSPKSLQVFLRRMGARSISNLVDITNMVLFEYGQPLHFFDADKMDPQTIHVRRAKNGEKLKTLDEKELELTSEDLVVADTSGPLTLAGIMGGASSAVSETTKNILMEVASFDPRLIRASSKRHGISSESSVRFERGVTPARIDEVVERALGLVREWSGYETAQGMKVLDREWKPGQVLWDRARLEGKLGKFKQSDDELFELLRRLDYQFDPKGGGSPAVIFPGYRSDMQFFEDVMEDVARLVGYDQLEVRPLESWESVSTIKDLNSHVAVTSQIVEDFRRKGFSEVIHLSFTSKKYAESLGYSPTNWVEIKNPIHSDRDVLRKSLLPDLIERAKLNAFQSEEDILLVESGPVYQLSAPSLYENSPVGEQQSIAVVWLPKPSDKKVLWADRTTDDFFVFKGMVESVWAKYKNAMPPAVIEFLEKPQNFYHPKRFLDGIGRGQSGELHPKWVASLDLPGRAFVGEWLIGEKAAPIKLKYERPRSQPVVDLDANFLVDDQIPMGELIAAMDKVPKRQWLMELKPYDIFSSKDLPQGKRAITFAMRYGTADRSLTLEEAKSEHERLVSHLITTLGNSRIALR